MKNKGIHEVKFDDISTQTGVIYTDGDIVLIDDFRQLPDLLPSTTSFNFNLFVICLKGKMLVELQTKRMELNANEVLYCKSNTIVNHCMISPDFDGKILCLSSRILQRFFHADKAIWRHYFAMIRNPILHIGEERTQLYEYYYQLLDHRIHYPSPMYNKEVMSALINAAMYELLAILMARHNPSRDDNLLQQGDILFKRFIDILMDERVHKRTVAHYAAQLCVTSKYLSTVVKRASGKTAFQWINQFVVEDVEYQLKYSDRSIKEVAEVLHFENLSFFGKYVRRHLGCSPKEFRKRLGMNDK